jgi:hypothetical protein
MHRIVLFWFKTYPLSLQTLSTAVGMAFAIRPAGRNISVQGKEGLRLMLWTILLVLLVLWLLGFIGGVGGNLIHLLLLIALVVLVLQLITGRRAVV